MTQYKGWDEKLVRMKRESDYCEGESPKKRRVQSPALSSSPPPPPVPVATSDFTPINLPTYRSDASSGSQCSPTHSGVQPYVHPGFRKLPSANRSIAAGNTPARKKATPVAQLHTPPATDKKVRNPRQDTSCKIRTVSDGLPSKKPKGNTVEGKGTNALSWPVAGQAIVQLHEHHDTVEGKDALLEALAGKATTKLHKDHETQFSTPFAPAQTTMEKLAAFRFQPKPSTNPPKQVDGLKSSLLVTYRKAIISPDPSITRNEQDKPFEILQGKNHCAIHAVPDEGKSLPPKNRTNKGHPFSARIVSMRTGELTNEPSSMLEDIDDNDLRDLLQAYDGPKDTGTEDPASELIADAYSPHGSSIMQNIDFEDQIASVLWNGPELNEDPGSGIAIKDLSPYQDVEERFFPPSDLDYPFDDNSQSMEIFDSNREGSPVISHHATDVDQSMAQLNDNEPTKIMAFHVDKSGDHSAHSGERSIDQFDEVEDWAFLNEDEVHELLDLTAAVSESVIGPITPPVVQESQPQSKDCVEPYTTALPSTSVANHETRQWDPNEPLKPFVRPPFPTRVRDRSPVTGLSSKMLLRTCFRIGEALNAGCAAARTGQSVILELYARVNFSSREEQGWKQYFQFSDLFHDRPPFLNGIYETWRGVDLWRYDSSLFLGEEGKGRMCRCIGRVKRDEKTKSWVLVILNIWAAVWEDITLVKSIVSA